MIFSVLLVYFFSIININCITFDYVLQERTEGLGEFPPVFSKTLGELADEKTLSKIDIGDLSFESLIERVTGFSWFPYIDIYLKDTLKVSPGNITEIRSAKVSLIINNMPKYNLDQFWLNSFKTLLFNVGNSLLQKTYDDVIDKLQSIYGYFKGDIVNEFRRANVSGGYLFHVYDKLLPIITILQRNKTNELPRNFGMSEKQIALLAGKSLDDINNDISTFVFANLHNSDEKSSYNVIMTSFMRRLQLYHSSLQHWSYTCAVYPGKTFQELKLNDISQKCFGMTMTDAAYILYDVPTNSSSLESFTMLELTQLANNTANAAGLINADTVLKEAMNSVDKVGTTSQKPFILIAREAGLSLNQMKETSVGQAVSMFLNIPWALIANIYKIPALVSAQINRVLFREISITDVEELELRILSLQMIIEILSNPTTISRNAISEDFESRIQYLSKIPITKLQTIFEISEENLKKYSLYTLTNEIFGIKVAHFLEIYGIPASKFNFYNKAILSDFGYLLVINERDIRHFSINQLIQQTIADAIFADVMLTSPNELISTKNSNVTERYSLSIPQIAHAFHDGITSYQSFHEYILKWSNSEAVARTLLENDIFDLSRTILRTVQDTGEMRIIEIVNSLISTFGSPCNATVIHCQKLQVCKQTDLGSRCQCIEGYRFSGPDVCTDLDECLFTKVTCDENASCQNTLGSYRCFCNDGFYGTGQECFNIDECLTDQQTCNTNAQCEDTKGSYKCSCNQGYSGDGFTCNDVNECLTGQTNCHRNADCQNTVGSYECVCKSGYEGDGINNCRDIDECTNATLHRCPSNSFCINKLGSHECECIGGFYKENGFCHQCLQGEGYCHINAECFQDPFEHYCVCKSGFKGNGTYCEDFNECENQNPCRQGECKNHIGSYSCLCYSGYRPNAANRVCLDIDECAEAEQLNIKLCNGTFTECVNVDGTYSCVSDAPNTAAKIALGVTVPLVLLIIVALFLIRRLRRHFKGRKELTSFDQRLNALYVNKGFVSDEKDSKMLTPTFVAEADSKISRPKNFAERTLRYIFGKENNNLENKEPEKPTMDEKISEEGQQEKVLTEKGLTEKELSGKN